MLATLQALKVAWITAETNLTKFNPCPGGKPTVHRAEIRALTAQRKGILIPHGELSGIVDDPAAANGIRTRGQMLNILGAFDLDGSGTVPDIQKLAVGMMVGLVLSGCGGWFGGKEQMKKQTHRRFARRQQP